jgi:hypothetical protein
MIAKAVDLLYNRQANGLAYINIAIGQLILAQKSDGKEMLVPEEI